MRIKRISFWNILGHFGPTTNDQRQKILFFFSFYLRMCGKSSTFAAKMRKCEND